MAPLGARGLVLDRHGERPRVEQLEVLDPGPGEVRVRMVAAGLCHTDVAAVRDARFVPILLGHEGTGVVESVGAGVRSVAPGDAVLLCWKSPCTRCRACAAGAPELCASPRTTAEPRVRRDGEPLGALLDTGCLSELVVVCADAAIPVPDGLDPAHAAVVGCAVATGIGAALHTAQVGPGEDVVVWGAGGIGLNVVTGAVLAQAAAIVAVDPDPRRRQLALDRGATVAVAPGEATAAVREATSGRGVDHAFETVGSPAIMAEAIDALAIGGQLTIVGAAARDAELAFAPRRLMSRQQRIAGCIYGSIRPRRDLPLLLGWLRECRIRVDDLLGVEVCLDAVADLFDGPAEGCVRPIVRF